MSALPKSTDRMPEAKPDGPPFSPAFLIAASLSMISHSWSGKLLSEESIPVNAVLDALKKGGWKIVPMEREDFK